ncbi:hypothetical protein D5S17_21065 [Pseudonocardiaceae bacterium YIM PH 21723]|nr:hypothetical protein D5S17_21065 [Pseudonocardiaceae bacterium YIM PH 21723]
MSSTWIEILGVIAMWVATIVRAPQAVRDPRQRGIWLAVVLIAVAMTVHMAEIFTALSTLADPHVLQLGSHVVTVADGTAVLGLIVAALTGRRYVWPLVGAGGLVIAVLSWIYLSAPPPTALDTELPLSYWWLFAGYHFAAIAVSALVCWRYAHKAPHWSLAGGLYSLGLGLAVACFMWVITLNFLITHVPAWFEYFGIFKGAEALLLAVGVLLPTYNSVRHRVLLARSYYGLGPIWRDLIDGVPSVALQGQRVSLRDRLWPAYPLELRLYRRTIEIRDAILTLRDYITPAELNEIRQNLAAQGIDTSADGPAFTAHWVEAARKAAKSGRAPLPHEDNITELGGADRPTEVEFLLQVAKNRPR